MKYRQIVWSILILLLSSNLYSNVKVLSKKIDKTSATYSVELNDLVSNLNGRLTPKSLEKVVTSIPGVVSATYFSKVEEGKSFPKKKTYIYQIRFSRGLVKFDGLAKIKSSKLCSVAEKTAKASKCKNFSLSVVAPVGVAHAHSDFMSPSRSPESFSKSFSLKLSFNETTKADKTKGIKATYSLFLSNDLYSSYLYELVKTKKIESVPSSEAILKSFVSYLDSNVITVSDPFIGGL